jgi:adenylate kinase
MSDMLSRERDDVVVGKTRPYRVLLVGPPGSGKSTQAIALAQRVGAAYISTGEMLREEARRGSPIGLRAAADMSAGRLVPDWLIALALERPMSDAMQSGFVLDGYPRTLAQAEVFTRSLGRSPLDRVIELDVPDDVVMLRLERRLRGDDDHDVVRSRLRIYRRETEPMLAYFASRGILATVDGTRVPEAVASDLSRMFGTIDSPGNRTTL